jgi:hypothetical protein
MTARIFYRFRHCFANGPGEWEYRDTSVAYESWAELVRETREELEKEYEWSDLYRGVEIEQIDRPPVEWLRNEAEQSKKQAEYHRVREQEFKHLIEVTP